MTPRRPTLLATALLSVVASPAAADDGWRLAASVRVRGEAIAGQPRATGPADDQAIFTRVRVSAEFERGPIVIGGEIVDSRAFSERADSTAGDTEINALEPSQLYASVAATSDTRVKAGRFFLNLGSRRLLAENGFRNTINSFTGVRIDHGTPDNGIVAFWVLPHDRLPDDRDGLRDTEVVVDRERTAQQLFGTFAATQWGGVSAEAYLFRLVERDADGFASRDRRLWTSGARLRHVPGQGLFFEVEGAAQWGTARLSAAAADRNDRPVRAGFAHASLGHAWGGAWRPRVRLALDYASGDRPGGAYTRFDTLFGARSFDFGPTGFYGAVARANLISAELRGDVRPGSRWEGFAAIRPLWADSAADTFGATGVRDPAGAGGRYAGVQVDARLRYDLIADRLRLAGGAAYLAKGALLRRAPNAPNTGDTRFGYLEVTLTL